MANHGTAAKLATVGPVRPDSPLPLYHQASEQIRRYLADSRAVPGDPIPSESRLQDLLGVSRVTVRRAISDLISAQVLVSRRGLGHFVAMPAAAPPQCLQSFTESALRSGHDPGARLLVFERVDAAEPAASSLRVDPGTPLTHIKRLRLLDGSPVFISDSLLRPDLASGLRRASLKSSGPEQSLYHALTQASGLQLNEGEEITSAVIADADVAAVLHVAMGSALVRKVCVLRDVRDEPVLYEEAIWAVPTSAEVKVQLNDRDRLSRMV